jgi:L1 cell adhesion molecule like protein
MAKEKIASLRSAIEKQDAAAIKQNMEELEKLMHEMAAVAYQSSSGSGGQPGPQGPSQSGGESNRPEGKGKKQDDVIDAEYEEST